MTEYHARIFWILIFLFSLAPVHGAWAGSPSDQLRAGIDRAFQILGDPQMEGDAQLKQRRTAIVTVANEIFDFGEMAKRSLGQFWAQRTLAELEEFVHLFTRVVQHSYISKVDQLGVGKMTVQGEVVEGEYAVVRTKLPLSSGRGIPSTTGCTVPTTAGGCMTSASRGSASWRTTGRSSTKSSGPPRTRRWSGSSSCSKRNPQCRPPRNALRHESEGRPPRLSNE